MKRILLVKTSSLGDVIHNLPVVNDIVNQFPDAQIDWIVEESFADIPRLHPKINHVFTVAMRRWRKQLFKAGTWQQIKTLRWQLSTRPYDIVIDTQGLVKSAVITHFAKGIKHGYDKHSIRESLASYFYDQKHDISYQQHAVTRNRALAALSLGYAPPTENPDYGILVNHVIFPSIKDAIKQPYIIALHGTSRNSKLWPEAHWVTLGEALETQGLSLVLPWASNDEKQRATRIQTKLKHAVVLPKLSIADIASVTSQAKAAIGVDTGLSHLAAALNIPTIAIYTDTNPVLTGVMAGSYTKAVNLGNINHIPSPSVVLAELNNL